MEHVNLNIPVLLLSTELNREGESTKRFLTPFGAIDVAFRKIEAENNLKPTYEIEVDGDTDSWISSAATIDEFRATLQQFVLGIARKHWNGCGPCDVEQLSFHIKGPSVNLWVPIQEKGV